MDADAIVTHHGMLPSSHEGPPKTARPGTSSSNADQADLGKAGRAQTQNARRHRLRRKLNGGAVITITLEELATLLTCVQAKIKEGDKLSEWAAELRQVLAKLVRSGLESSKTRISQGHKRMSCQRCRFNNVGTLALGWT